MTEIKFRHDFDVTLVDSMGSDLRVCQAARVSTKGAESYETDESKGLIEFLMLNRHGTPFESVIFQWLISAPIFVWREFMRHRIASYSEESGRYRKLEPVFYIIPKHRPFVQEGKAGEYNFVKGSSDVYEEIVKTFKIGAQHQYDDYEYILSLGVGREVARMELPLNIYSSAYVTMNARALMNFLSLRTKNDESYFKSFPQWEIEQVAKNMEQDFKKITPLVYNAFNKAKRVSP